MQFMNDARDLPLDIEYIVILSILTLCSSLICQNVIYLNVLQTLPFEVVMKSQEHIVKTFNTIAPICCSSTVSYHSVIYKHVTTTLNNINQFSFMNTFISLSSLHCIYLDNNSKL